MKPRKDYGCPLRIYFGARWGCHTVLPPRSLSAADRCNHKLDGLWDGVHCHDGAAELVRNKPGPHLGQRIHWREVPPAVQHAIRQSFLGEYCPKEGPMSRRKLRVITHPNGHGKQPQACCPVCGAAVVKAIVYGQLSYSCGAHWGLWQDRRKA